MSIPMFLKALRERRGLSMDDLGARIEATGSTISKLEKGQMKLTLEWMEKLAPALGVHPADLIDDRPPVDHAPLTADVVAYVARAPNDLLLALRRDGHELYRVTSEAMSAMGITLGTILLVNMAAVDVETLDVGETVLVQVGAASAAPVLLIRQYLPPALLTTNSVVHNQIPLLARPPEVAICGVVAHKIR